MALLATKSRQQWRRGVKMAEHIWSVLCSKSVIDKDTQQVSLFDVLEALHIQLEEPIKSPGLIRFATEVVSLWVRSERDAEETATTKCEVITPDGESVHAAEMALDFSEKRRFRSIFRAEGFPLHGSGVYKFKVSVKDGASEEWRLAALLPIEVTVKSPNPEKSGRKAAKSPRKKQSRS
jgi:hypothetical protein